MILRIPILFRDKNLPERTVCVQFRKRFFTLEQPLYPGLPRNYEGINDTAHTHLVPEKILPERTVCVQSRKRFFTPEQPLYPGLPRN